MTEILKIEFRNCLNRFQFKLMFLLLSFISVASFIIICYVFYGDSLYFIRSAYEQSLVMSIYLSNTLYMLCLTIPLFATIIYSDSYITDRNEGVHKSIAVRTDFRKYIVAKAIVTFVMTWFSFFFALALNQLLCFIAFPVVGADNNFALPSYDIGVQNYTPYDLFDLLRLESPALYNWLYMIIFSLFAGIVALLIYAMFLVLKIGRFGLMAGVFAALIVAEVATHLLDLDAWTPSKILLPRNDGTPLSFAVWFILPFAAAVVMIIKSLNKEPELD